MARGSTVMQFIPSEITQAAALPESPAVGQLVQFTGAAPNELLMWTGNGTNPTKRRYAATKSGASVTIGDLSDDHALDVTVKTIADQAGSGTPLPSNVRPISGKASVTLTVNGAGYVFAPPHQMLGLSNAMDMIGSDGGVRHQTDAIVLNGSENWTTNPGWAGNAYVLSGAIPHALPVSGYGTVAELMCSHFPAEAPATIAEGTLGIGVGNGTEIYVGFPDTSIVAFQSVSAFKTWLAAHPVVLVYRLATPFDETVAPVEIAGADGVNTITSDGASVTVDYTGSGWAAVGAVTRLNVEAVSISPEQGLRVDTLLTGSAAQQAPAYFNARGTQVGLYRTSDDRQIWGGKVLRSGEVAAIVTSLVDPDGEADARVRLSTYERSAHLQVMTPSYDGVTVQHPDNNPDPTGETDAITITGGVQPLWNAALGRYEDARYGAISSDRHLDLSSYGGYVQLSGSEANNGDGIELFTDSGYMVMGSATHPDGAAMFDMHVIPAESGTYSLGASSVAKRWKYVYLNNNPNVSSDERIKRDIEPIRGADALLAAIPAYQFRMADDPDALHYGTTWQAVRDALAAADINGAAILGDDPDDDRQVHGLLYGEFTGLLIAALAEHRDRIAALEARLDAPETAG